MKPSDEFIYALDDSGGIEPLLNKQRKFFPGDHPFFIIASTAINQKHYQEFEERWSELRTTIEDFLGVPDLPALHARLMFGKTKPPSYRGKPNPYLTAPDEKIVEWYLAAIQIFASYTQRRRGGEIYTVEYDRHKAGAFWENIFELPEAVKEGEYLKAAHRQTYPHLHKKYVAHVTSALVLPTLDTFLMIEGTMRQCGAQATILLDSYTDADGFNEEAAFSFLNTHLELGQISSVRAVPDTDSEPLCQAADLIAYLAFRSSLFKYRQRSNLNPPIDSWAVEASRLLWGSQRLCSMDMGKWVFRRKEETANRAVFNAARYALALHEIRKYAPEVVDQFFLSPEEFLEYCHSLAAGISDVFGQHAYLPILKSGVYDAWNATRQNGEDRS